jgi:hypothetical protein
MNPYANPARYTAYLPGITNVPKPIANPQPDPIVHQSAAVRQSTAVSQSAGVYQPAAIALRILTPTSK